jgi:excinuclease UvrABC nuclease subunit
VASLAKQFEEVYLPGRGDPVRIPRQSEALYLLQRIRDEAHRFAITYHRQLRGQRMTKSVVDDIPGLGPTRKKRLLKELGLDDEISVASLAKQFEEVFLPGRPDPVRIPRQSEALYLLQRLRDEAHRFAITYHRQLRGKRMTKSVLDGVPGLGPARKKRLVRELGGVNAVKAADLDALRALSWLPDRVADAVFAAVRGERAAS